METRKLEKLAQDVLDPTVSSSAKLKFLSVFLTSCVDTDTFTDERMVAVFVAARELKKLTPREYSTHTSSVASIYKAYLLPTFVDTFAAEVDKFISHHFRIRVVDQPQQSMSSNEEIDEVASLRAEVRSLRADKAQLIAMIDALQARAHRTAQPVQLVADDQPHFGRSPKK